MKKFSFLAVAAMALALVSCGNKTNGNDESQDTLSFEQAQVEEKLKVELDSIAEEWSKLQPIEGVFQNGKIKLSEDELKAKPEYLLDLKQISDLSTLSQKYRALGMIVVDQKVAALYKMNTDTYKNAFAKLVADVNDPAIKVVANPTVNTIQAFYKEEKDNGRINLFWEASAAAVIENLYIIAQNAEKFLPAFDDKAASDLTYHIALMKLSLDDLAAYDANIRAIDDVLAPLNELNAITVSQLKNQVEKMKPQIEAARAALLK